MTPKLEELDYFKAWLLFALVSLFGGFIAGAVVGGVLGGILGAAHFPVKTIAIVCGFAGFLAGLPISYLCFRFVVKHFIVKKLADQSTSPQTAPPWQP